MSRCRPVAVVLAASILLQFGCVTSSPSASEARAAFENENKGLIERSMMRVQSFQKTDGVTSEVFGVKMYQLAFRADVEYPQGLNTECMGEGFQGFNCLMRTVEGSRTRAVGAIDDVEGTVTFRRTEQGWQPEAVDFRTVASRIDPEVARRMAEARAAEDARAAKERAEADRLAAETAERQRLVDEQLTREAPAKLRAILTAPSTLHAETSPGPFTISIQSFDPEKGTLAADVAFKGFYRHYDWDGTAVGTVGGDSLELRITRKDKQGGEGWVVMKIRFDGPAQKLIGRYFWQGLGEGEISFASK